MAARRLFKVLLVAVAAADLALVVVGNLTDYDTNFQFVRHVMSMDTTFPDSTLRWRAVTSPTAHHAFYAILIAWEAVVAVLAGWGAVRLFRARLAGTADWERAKLPAEAALVASLLLWYAAFLVVGGEWFAMWQSATWNGQAAALRMFTLHGLVLLYLRQRDDEPPTAG